MATSRCPLGLQLNIDRSLVLDQWAFIETRTAAEDVKTLSNQIKVELENIARFWTMSHNYSDGHFNLSFLWIYLQFSFLLFTFYFLKVVWATMLCYNEHYRLIYFFWSMIISTSKKFVLKIYSIVKWFSKTIKTMIYPCGGMGNLIIITLLWTLCLG